MYLMVVASAVNVHFALAKNENVTATQKAMKLDKDCGLPLLMQTAKDIQWMSVFTTPTLRYLANILSISKFHIRICSILPFTN